MTQTILDAGKNEANWLHRCKPSLLLMKYRKEIDGLRALAVVPVILFHAGFSSFSGGFIGVDIFFVISGYLITSIIIEDIRSKNFSLRNFYERRARRILPALYLIMLVCLPFAWLWLQPADLRHFGKSIAAVALFISNFLFQKSGYFDISSELAPLLHTWSLAVEEQYYVFFPLLLILIVKSKIIPTIVILGILSICSLTYSQWGTSHHPEQAFFMLPSRGWELLLGAMIVLVRIPKKISSNEVSIGKYFCSKSMQQTASLVGLMLILISIAYLSEAIPFPGLWALPPTLGAVLIISFATPETITGKILGSKPFVTIGMISYSAYLFHQPILAFTHHRFPGDLHEVIILGLILATFGLAFLSWKFVEAPFRNREIISTQAILWLSIIFACIFFTLGLMIRSHDGFPNRFPTLRGFYADSQWNETLNKNDECYKKFGGEQYCQIAIPSKFVTDVLIGDSHSNHFFPGLSKHLATTGRNLLQQGAGGCPPFLYIDTGKHPTHGLLKCVEKTANLYQSILDSKTIDTVYLAFHHSGYFDKSIYPLRDLRNEIKDDDRLEFVSKALIRTIKSFESTGKEVRLIYDFPDLQSGEPLGCLLKEARNGKEGACSDSSLFIDDYANYDTLLSKIAQQTKVKIFYTKDYLGDFPRTPAGDWLYRDHTHLSVKGSLYLSSKFKFEEIRQKGV